MFADQCDPLRLVGSSTRTGFRNVGGLFGNRLEFGEPDLEAPWIGAFVRPPRLENRGTVKTLESAAEHWPVVLVE